MLGERLRELREKRKLLQADLAKMLGVGRTTYTQYETGKSEPDFEILTKLADFYDVSIDYLLGRTNFINYNPETIAAHHDGDEYTEEELAEIEKFKEFIKMKREQREKKE